MKENLATRENLEKLKQEVLKTFWYFNFYKNLFSGNNIDILNTYPHFFLLLKVSLEENIILGISKLLDPPQQGNYRNLVLEVFCKTNSEKETLKRLKDKLKKLRLRDYRNKLLAHLDIEYEKIRKEAFLDFKEIENILTGIANLMNSYGKNFTSWNNIHFIDKNAFPKTITDLNLVINVLKKDLAKDK